MFGIRKGPITLEEGEFWGDDGIPRCIKCGGKRRTINPYDTNEWAHMMCDCQRAERELKQQEFEARIGKPNDLIRESHLDIRYQNARFGANTIASNKKYSMIVNACFDYCTKASNTNGKGIFLYGSSGIGKTHIMACMVNELVRNGHRCLFTSMSELAKVGNDFLKEKAMVVKFLFIDDIGAERIAKGSDRDTWLQSQMFEIINARYGRKLPTIFSSNYSLNDLMEGKGLNERTVSRMREMCTEYQLVGESFRN